MDIIERGYQVSLHVLRHIIFLLVPWKDSNQIRTERTFERFEYATISSLRLLRVQNENNYVKRENLLPPCREG